MLSRVSWMIGDGVAVDVLRDAWLADLSLSRWPTFVSTDIASGMKVTELIAQDRTVWHSSRVATLFGAELSRRIYSIPLTSDCASDVRLWRRSSTTSVPVRDLVQEFRPRPRQTLAVSWIWKLPIHHRVRLFIWKLAWDCLPTCSLLSSRGTVIQPMCPLCGLAEETADHAIFTCGRATLVWQIAGYHSWDDRSSPCRTSFLRLIRLDRRGANRRVSSLAAYIAYQIWLSRNRKIFSDVNDPPQKIFQHALSLAAEYLLHQSDIDIDRPSIWDSPAASAAHRRTVFISWEPPPLGSIKINFDGSVQSRQAGSAFVIRDSDGMMIAAGGFGSLDLSVPLAELYAAWAGISYAIRSLGSRHILIEGDSTTVVRWIRQDLGDPLPTNPLLCHIRSLLHQASTVQVRHIYREANSAADWVAGWVAHHSNHWSWRMGDSCPIVLSQILYSDMSGLTHTRLV